MKKVIISVIILLVILVSIVLGKLLITPNNTSSENYLSNELNRYSSYNLVTDKDGEIENCEYVTFNAFFIRDVDGDGYAEKYDGTCNHLSKTANLYFDIDVLTNGTLKDGKITVNGKNFILSTTLVKDDVLEKDYIGSNITEFKLKDLKNGTQKLFSGKISANIGNNIDNYSVEDNTVTLTGKWVSSNGGDEKQIEKVITLKTDWHGITNTVPYSGFGSNYSITTSHDIEEAIGSDDVTLTFDVGYQEIAKQLLLQKQITEVIIPDLNGEKATEVVVTSQNCDYKYDEGTRILTITRTAQLDEEKKTIISEISRFNSYRIQVKYPLIAYESLDSETISLFIQTKGSYYGYNNSSDQFKDLNPYISSASKDYNHIWRKGVEAGPAQYSPSFDVYVGKYVYNVDSISYRYVISKEMPLKIYNNIGQDEDDVDEYIVQWRAYTGNSNENQNGVYLEEDKEDHFYKDSVEYQSMKDYITTRAVYFSNLNSFLGDNGWLKVYDAETGELLKKFTKKDWDDYSSTNPYEFGKPVKSIKVETSIGNENSYLYVYQIKVIDDELLTDTIQISDFNEIDHIYSYLKGGIYTDKSDNDEINNSENDSSGEDLENNSETDNSQGSNLENNQSNDDSEDSENTDEQRSKTVVTDSANAYYEAPVSTATFSIDPSIISNQETKSVIMKINAQANYYNEKKWKNGEFLIELPDEILAVEIKSITSTENKVKVSSYETYEENNKQYIKIYTKNDEEDIYTLTINADLTADPREATTTKNVKLYAINEECPNYRANVRCEDSLDMNGNENKKEYVFTKTASLQIVAPSSLLTSQTLSDFDDKNTEVVSPQIAILDKSDNSRDAQINVTITNNYSGTISEPIIIGKIPFQGNTYQLNEGELNSTYSVTMKEDGITLPNGLNGKATVYYSTNSTVNADISDSSNNWKKHDEVDDWNSIKTYAIDLSSHKMPVKESLNFSYKIEVPTNVKYNDVAYSTHAVYFCLDTEDGKLRTQTEVNRLGIMIAKKYDINITKYKLGKNKKVQGATYKVTDGSFTRTGITDKDGNITISGLYVDKVYTLTEIQSPNNYILNDKEMKFKVTVGEGGEPEVKIILENGEESSSKKVEGLLKKDATVSKLEDGTIKLDLEVEDNAKYDLKIIKSDNAEESKKLKGVKFRITGGIYGENGRIFTTNESGEILISNLIPGQEYELEETKAIGYYLKKDKMKFSVSRENNNNLKITSEKLTSTSIEEKDDQDKAVITVNLTNEAIPTYTLNIEKKSDKQEPLEGTQFKLTSLDTGDVSYATTDEEGNLKFEGLYEFVKDKEDLVKGEYIIQEILATEGYITDNTEVKFKASKKSEGGFDITFESGSEKVKSSSTEDGITLNFENKPIFNLTKTGDNGELLPNAKFKVLNLEGDFVQDINGEPIGDFYEMDSLEFYTSGDAPWVQREDGTWESTMKNENSSNSMISNEFVIKENGKISFDWASSSQSSTTDYVSYKITNIDTKQEVGASIGGYTSNDTYESLKFTKVEESLKPGKYKIEFKYTKNGSTNNGLDAGFVKNIKVSGGGYYGLITDENGQITANLPQGLYQVIEVEAPEGYILPENIEDRIHYVGIGEARKEATEFGVEWSEAISGKGFSNINEIEPTEDGGYVIAGSFAGQSDFDGDGKVDATSKGDLDAVLVKYDKNGKLEWLKDEGEAGADEFNSVCLTSDGGYIVSGYETNTFEDAILAKISSSGNVDWKRTMSGDYEDKALDATILSNGDIVVVGRYYASSIKFEGNENLFPNSGLFDGFVACYGSNGEYKWAKTLNGTKDIEVRSVTDTSNGVVVSANFLGTMNITDSSHKENATKQGSVLVSFSDEDGIYQWDKKIDGSNDESIVKLITDDEDKVIALGGFASDLTIDDNTKITPPTTSYSNGLMLKYSAQGEYESNFVFGGTSMDDKFTTAIPTEDGGLILGGWFYSSSFTIDEESISNTKDNTGNSYSSISHDDGIIIKLNEENEVEWTKTIKGSSYDSVSSIVELEDGGFAIAGNFESSSLSITDKSNILSNGGYSDSFVINLDDVVTEAEIPQVQEINAENELKQFRITTEIGENSDKQRTGGTITGEGASIKQNINWVEDVKYGYTSQKQIVMDPDDDYSVYSVKVDGEEVPFSPDEDGVVTLPVFENVTQDHHIVVVFEKNLSSVLVHHYLKDREGNYTKESLAPDEYLTGKVDSDYETHPKIDISGYSLEKEQDSDEFKTPQNAIGKYEEKQIEVTYYYEEMPLKLTVHHYLEGTQDRVSNDEEQELYKGSEFKTQVKDELLKKYVVVEESTSVTPDGDNIQGKFSSSVSGTINENTEVIYYYKLKEFEITTEVKLHEEFDIAGEAHEVKGGDILGEGKKPYETVIIEKDSTKEIKATALDGYEIKSLVIQSIDEEDKVVEEKSIELNPKTKIYDVPKFTDVDSDKHVIVEFIKIQGKVTVHHYIEGTDDDEDGPKPVPKKDGTDAQDEVKEGAVGDSWASKPLDDVSEKYEVSKTPENSSGTFEEEPQDITYYYTLKDTSVLVHHYIEGTTKQLSDDVTIPGKVDDSYKTEIAKDIPSYYELVSEPTNKEGTMTVDQIVVIYYYRLKKYQYTVNYLEDGTNEILSPAKTAEVDHGTEIVSENEKIEINGYNFTRYDKDKITIEEDIEKNVINIYYTKRGDLSYVVNYLEKGTNKVLNTQKAVDSQAFGTIITTKNEIIDITGYKYDSCDKDELTIGTDISQNVINIYYVKDTFKYTVHYFYDGVEDKDEIVEGTAEFESTIDKYTDKNKGYVFEKHENCPLIVGAEEDKNIINVYYRTQYKITTDVIEHTEKYKDGTTIDSVKGGTISGEDLEYYELVFKGDSNENKIEMKPDEGYEIVKVIINEIEIENLEITEDGILVLDAGYFSDVQEDQHIEVEFRKKSKVTVKYLEKDTETELSEPTEIPGYEGKDFTTDRKVITAYKAPEVGITDEEKKHIDPDGVMYADEIVIIYWYEKISSGIIERHIEINEKAEVSEIESSTIEGFVLDEKTIARKTYEGYIAVDGPQNENPDIIVAKKDDTEIKVVMQENKIIEVWYYYEKQYDITTEVKQHKEIKDGVEQLIDGGRISKEYEIDEQGNKNEIVYEKVLSRGDNKKIIEMVPDDGYRIKALCINDTQIDIKEMVKEDKSIVLAEKYFEDVQENKHVVVEFEKIPAKVIVKYQDIDTKEDIEENKEVEGYVNDPYSEERIEIEDYIPAGDEPENKSGNMVEEDTIVIFYYKKQFKITTDVKEHEESGADGNKYPVKGGSISGEDELPYEKVLRGENSTKNIDIKPESGYRPKKITINGEEIELKDTTRLALFENMQEDKHIVVEFERIPARVVIKYIDENSGNEVAEKEIIEGFVNDEYTSSSKDIEGYELVSEKLPGNASGKLAEDEIVVIYYYRKIEEVAQEQNIEQIEEPVVEEASNIIENAVVEQIKDNIRDVKTGDNIFNTIIVLITSVITFVVCAIKKHKNNKKDK